MTKLAVQGDRRSLVNVTTGLRIEKSLASAVSVPSRMVPSSLTCAMPDGNGWPSAGDVTSMQISNPPALSLSR